jgi:7,8-dihydropterin-6-yl-methyl-4-(beta-D-ribofuranosyl)aminobenzene 5'-phosphate synthase
LLPDDLEEDQALVFNIKDKGLVILSGCAHSGILNTIYHAKEIAGVDRIYALIGGFHLARSDEDEIMKTINLINQENPSFVIPHHCTGFKALCKFAQEMPGVFIEGIVGATYYF